MANPADASSALTADEALVLLDFPHWWEDDDHGNAPQHAAEQVALWNLPGLLEREIRQPFDPGYADLVAEARFRLTPSD
ncbi:hypothetical protein [Nocardioides zeicaulis]|uniref:Uncharacterized protein n=1 Tax=Nocardioides zeicaulis TaxID=1776857 RepID=A0ABV6E7F8_9ACTN